MTETREVMLIDVIKRPFARGKLPAYIPNEPFLI